MYFRVRYVGREVFIVFFKSLGLNYQIVIILERNGIFKLGENLRERKTIEKVTVADVLKLSGEDS